MPDIRLEAIEPWAPHPKAAPCTARVADHLDVMSNATRTCCGGWQVRFRGIAAGQRYALQTVVAHAHLACPREALLCTAIWGQPGPADQAAGACWDYLNPVPQGEDRLRFEALLTAPAGAECLTVRCTLRWTEEGSARWQIPQVLPAEAAAPSRPVKVCVVTGNTYQHRGNATVASNTALYTRLCEDACRRDRPDLIALPEICLQWGVPGHALDLALSADSPEVGSFAALAARYQTRIVLGMLERDGDAVFNSALLISPAGQVDGVYHKVHLAAGGEDVSGILPGDGFPVYDTEIGRIGCNICMDSSAAESARMVGLGGADFLVLPIMGDHRADRWNPGIPIYHEDRWKSIQRTRAMDNQLCMVVARNTTQGSCIIDRKGEILAWNEGDREYITAAVSLEDGYRTWNGGCFRAINWQQRRPHLYAAFTEPWNIPGGPGESGNNNA